MSSPLPPVKIPHPHVVLDSRGSPLVEGSRIPVRRLFAWHREKTAVATILKRYPQLGPARLFDALSFAYDNLDLILADLDLEREAIETKRLPETPLFGKRPKADNEAQLALPFKPT